LSGFRGFLFQVPAFFEDGLEGFLAGAFGELGFGGQGAMGWVVGDFFYDAAGFGLGSGCSLWREVAAGDLEAVEEEASAAGIYGVGGDAAEDFADGKLDGGSVFGELKVKAGVGVARAVCRFAGGVVVVAEIFVTERWAAAAVSVGEDVAALEAWWCGRHACGPPWPGLVLKS
jgi:hypothetical protein